MYPHENKLTKSVNLKKKSDENKINNTVQVQNVHDFCVFMSVYV